MTPQDHLSRKLAETGYVADETLSMALHLSLELQRPLLLEGEAGVGKTEIGRALATSLDCELIRLQCYEGLDASAAIYEWNYQRQLLAIKAHEHDKAGAEEIEDQIFSSRYLLERPLLASISRDQSPVLLIDEIDRADEEFEAYLLEVLADYQITIPELGTIQAKSIPRVILTSNGTRALSDALRRRCLYCYVEFPEADREAAIIRARQPETDAALAGQVARFVRHLRMEDLEKVPGIAESLDWCAALAGLGVRDLQQSPDLVQQSLICLLKTEADLKSIPPEVTSRLAGKAA